MKKPKRVFADCKAFTACKVITVCIIIMSLSMNGCAPDRRAKNGGNYALSDLGGVYSSVYCEDDYDVEISGRLPEDDNYDKAEKKGEGKDTKDEKKESAAHGVSAQNGLVLDTRLRSWGISRRPGNQVPAADPGAPELLKKYNGLYLGDTSQKRVYLTFDEGYENGYTPKILDVLRDNNVTAIFFITGPYLKSHQDLVRRMVEEGHHLGNHTIHHPSLPTLDEKTMEEEVVGLERAFKEKFGIGMKFLRPPKGEYSEKSLAVTSRLGYCNLFWSFAYDDWYRDKSRGAEYAYDIVMRNLHNGAVILLHAVSRDNAEALDRIIKGIRANGYEIGHPDELLSLLKSGSEE